MVNYQDLLQQSKNQHATLKAIVSFVEQNQMEEQLNQLELKLQTTDSWRDAAGIQLARQHQRLQTLCQQTKTVTTQVQDLCDLLKLFSEQPAQLEELALEMNLVDQQLNQLQIALLLGQENDSKPCFISITPGAGGTESQDWAAMLLRMYLRYCEQQGLQAITLEMQPGDGAGIKNALLNIKGTNAYGLLQAEHGIHRLVRISPFDANKRRHTSFAAVSVWPELEDVAVTIKPDELRIDTYRSSGAGGQHVNTTDSAVRITHLPTNLVVTCQDERSQGQNKQRALKVLQARLAELYERDRHEKQEAGQNKKSIEWGSQIRSYVLHPYKLVKDHRTDLESFQPDAILDGGLSEFIQAYLVARPKLLS